MKRVLQNLISTRPEYAATLGRVTLGAVTLPHGLQKTVGLFGGYGFEGTLGFFKNSLGIPTPLGVAVVLIESVGALLLILGALGRVWAALIGAVMAVAAVMVHGSFGFFMNWFGNQKGEGIEFHLLAIALAGVVVVLGSGKLSIDELIAKQRNLLED